MKNIKAVAFDCDGVMFDTEDTNKEYYNRILFYFDKPAMTQEQVKYVHMHTVKKALGYLFDYDEALLNKVYQYKEGMEYFPFIKYMRIEPYLIPLLKKLRPNYKTAIATNRTNTMDMVLREHNLESYFDISVTASDVKRPKPHPDLLFKIMEYFDIRSDEIIYIGDSELDEIASKEADVPFVAFKNPDLLADFHINSLNEIERILDYE